MRRYRRLAALWALVASFWICGAALAAPQVGWWWNPNESGRGFFVESQNGVTFVGAYFYDADGHAKWLVAGGQNADPYNYTGPLYELSGGQSLFGSYVAPSAPSSVGNVTVHFDDDTHGTWTWPGGSIAIERQIFGGTDAPFQPFSGWWWNPNESGTGYSIEVQGNYLFVVGFMYDNAGRQVWYFSAGPMSSPSTYHGTVLQFANGQTMGGAYQPPSAPATVAALDLQFTALNKATLTFTSSPSALADRLLTKGAATRTDDIVTQFYKDPGYSPANYYIGNMHSHVHESGTIALGGPAVTVNGDIAVDGTNLVWQRFGEPDSTSVEGVTTSKYILRGGDFSIAGDFDQVVNGLPCTEHFTASAPITYPSTSGASLEVDNYAHFHLNTSLSLPPTLQYSSKTNCPNGAVDMTLFVPYLMGGIEKSGVVAYHAFSNDTLPQRVKSVADADMIDGLLPIGTGAYNLDWWYRFFENDICDQSGFKYCPPPQP
jgi:hypothetical protein